MWSDAQSPYELSRKFTSVATMTFASSRDTLISVSCLSVSVRAGARLRRFISSSSRLVDLEIYRINTLLFAPILWPCRCDRPFVCSTGEESNQPISPLVGRPLSAGFKLHFANRVQKRWRNQDDTQRLTAICTERDKNNTGRLWSAITFPFWSSDILIHAVKQSLLILRICMMYKHV